MLIRTLLVIAFALSCINLYAKAPVLDSMICGNRKLELLDNHQLTFHKDGEVTFGAISPDGKNVAYTVGDDYQKLCMIKSSGGKTTVLLDDTKYQAVLEEDEPLKETSIILNDNSYVVWSPDSRKLAVATCRLIPSEDNYTEEDGLLIIGTKGSGTKFIPAPQDVELTDFTLAWSPDGNKVAVDYEQEGVNDEPGSEGIALFNVTNGTAHSIFAQNDGHINQLMWTAAGESLFCYHRKDRKKRLVEIYTDGRPARVVDENYQVAATSTDGLYKHQQMEDFSDSIVLTSTGKTVRNIEREEGMFSEWVPNSLLFTYNQRITMDVKADTLEREYISLWLGNLEDHKYNHMCIALDRDNTESPSWSEDNLKMTYLSKGRLYFAELAWSEPDPFEKCEVGLPLTEEDEKIVLQAHAKQLGRAIKSYSFDYEDNLPPAESIENDLKAYIESVHLKPDKYRFVYRLQYEKLSNIEDPANTLVGTIDSSFSWKAALYADGHVACIDK